MKRELPKWTQTGLPLHQKAELRAEPPIGEDWRYEIKWDGYRAFALTGSERPLMTSSNGNDLKQYKLAAHISEAFNRTCILDGEIVWIDQNGRSDFGLLRGTHFYKQSDELKFVAFDILRLDDWDLRPLPLRDRLEVLEGLFKSVKSPRILLSQSLTGSPIEILQDVCERGLEGIIAKNLDSIYKGIRTPEWQKIKCRRKDKGFVIGYTLYAANPEAIGALLIGETQNGRLVHIGRVGTGFTTKMRIDWFKRLRAIEIEDTDADALTKEERKGVRWVEPTIQIEFEMAERTNAGLLRQASFVREIT